MEPCGGNVRTEACALTEEYGVFVAPEGRDTLGDGSRLNPYRTLAHAMARAAEARKVVYACSDAGVYEEGTLEIDSSLTGVQVLGAFVCGESNWRYNAMARAELRSSSTMAIRMQGAADVMLEGLRVVAADAVEPGESSLGILIADSENILLTSMEVEAGVGMGGEDGEGYDGRPATRGASGTAGEEMCSTGLGGAAVTTVCETGDSVGGKGGDGGEGTAPGGSGELGLPEPSPNPSGAGWGGIGAIAMAASCTSGTAGADGEDGEVVAGGQGLGTIGLSGYRAVDGEAGRPGTTGQGGGGGGGAYRPNTCATGGLIGASGGSGGGGGCGGLGGGRGQGGGASIAVASLDSGVTMEYVALVVSAGGDGGNGGQGQLGGSPGEGRFGGAGACGGGNGGLGGDGSSGGGGAGGPSLGVAYTGSVPVRSAVEVTLPASGASGGLGGDGTVEASNGEAGQVAALRDLLRE